MAYLIIWIAIYYHFSGAEDHNGYIWDRNYEICLGKLPHKNVVNSVAFNPKDEQMVVTVGDDHKIKVKLVNYLLRWLLNNDFVFKRFGFLANACKNARWPLSKKNVVKNCG